MRFGNVFLDADSCPSCENTALGVMTMLNGGPCTTMLLKPVEVVLLCGDCGRSFHARAWKWVLRNKALPASTSVGVVDAIHEEGGDAIVSNRPGPEATDAGARAGANTRAGA